MGPASLFLKDPSGLPLRRPEVSRRPRPCWGRRCPCFRLPSATGTATSSSSRSIPSCARCSGATCRRCCAQIGVDAPEPAGARRPSASRPSTRRPSRASCAPCGPRTAAWGSLNLFWLAHTRDVAEYLRELEAKQPGGAQGQVLAAPAALLLLPAPGPGRGARSSRRTRGGVPAGCARTRASSSRSSRTASPSPSLASSDARLQPLPLRQQALPAARGPLLRDLQSWCGRRSGGCARATAACSRRVARHLPGLPSEQHLQTAGRRGQDHDERPRHDLPVRRRLDDGRPAPELAQLKAEAERRKPAEIVDAFLDVIAGREALRDRVARCATASSCIGAFGRELDLEDKASRSLRIYEFGDAAQVLNNAVNATVLFLDLRGFTQTSEGQISERDLTRELYAVFDEFVPLVRRFGGTVDKFLGDGIMVTFGTEPRRPPRPAQRRAHRHPLPGDAAAAAQGGQDVLQDGRRHPLRPRLPRALHRGRGDGPEHGHRPQRQPGGPAVLGGQEAAGRGRGRRPAALRACPRLRPAGDGGRAGTLFNEGIAISRDTLVQLEAHLALDPRRGARRWSTSTSTIGRRILIRYAGDAKFKGVRSSLPVYEVDYEART